MKLDLKILKNALIIKDNNNAEIIEVEDEIKDWIKSNIGDGEVSIREWLDEFDKYWSKWGDDYGDSGIIEDILLDDYNLSENKVDKIMSIYWGCNSIKEYREDFK